MAIIKVAHNVSDVAISRIEQVADETLKHDCNWSGAEITIKRGEFTCVECTDEIAGAQLLAKVHQAIED